MMEVGSMVGNKLQKSRESTGPLLVKQSIILTPHERSCTLSHCQRPGESHWISITFKRTEMEIDRRSGYRICLVEVRDWFCESSSREFSGSRLSDQLLQTKCSDL